MKRAISKVLIVLLVLFIISACGLGPGHPTVTPTATLPLTAPGVPTATNTRLPTNTPIPTPAATATATPIPDMRFGYTDRRMNCPLITEIVALVLEQELGVSVETKFYETEDQSPSTGESRSPTEQLFAGLTSGDIDLTLCFFEPEDREYIVRKIRPINKFYYYPNKKIKLSIYINDKIIVRLKEYNPCIYDFFEKIEFEDPQFDEQNATSWSQKHRDKVQLWTSCDSSSP